MPRINLWEFLLIFRFTNLLSIYTLWYFGLWFRVYHLEDGYTVYLREGSTLLDSSWDMMAHGDAREGKWRGNWRMEWVASTLHTTSEHGVSSITTADAHNSATSIRLNWRPCQFKWTRPFRRKTKSGFCACAITFKLASTSLSSDVTWVTTGCLTAVEIPNVLHRNTIVCLQDRGICQFCYLHRLIAVSKSWYYRHVLAHLLMSTLYSPAKLISYQTRLQTIRKSRLQNFCGLLFARVCCPCILSIVVVTTMPDVVTTCVHLLPSLSLECKVKNKEGNVGMT